MLPGITYKQFGKYLLDSLDLDPLYVILTQSNMNDNQMKRWLLAYWIYYSAGVSSRLSEVSNPTAYYRMMRYGNDNRWPRGHERRHMRGQTFIETVLGLEKYGAPEKVVDHLTCALDFDMHTRVVSKLYGFGQWIAFKIFDMMERVLRIPTNIDNVNLYIYRDPVKGAALWEFGDQNHNITHDELGCVVCELMKMFKGYSAPPFMDRPLSPMEIETILCKSKSNYNGHYPLGNDVIDIQHGLGGWGDTAQELECLLKPLYNVWEAWSYEDRNVRVIV